MNKYIILLRIFLLSTFPFLLNFAGCDVPPSFPEDVVVRNIINDYGINNTQMRLYLQCGSTVKSILSVEHFIRFKNYDIIGVNTGIIKAATIPSGSTLLPDQKIINEISSNRFLDAEKMGYDGGIYLCCTNSSGLSAQGLTLGNTGKTINGYNAYNLDAGMSFTLDTAMRNPVTASFKIYGITNGIEKNLIPIELNITFYKNQHTKRSIAKFDNVSKNDLDMSSTTDTLFTKMLIDIKKFDENARSSTANSGSNILSYKKLHVDEDSSGYDSIHIKTVDDYSDAFDWQYVYIEEKGYLELKYVYIPEKDPFYGYSVGDTVYCGVNEKSAVHASIQNAKVFLAKRLIKKIDTAYTCSSCVKTLPDVGPDLDNYLSLYSNISGFLDALNTLKDASTFYKINLEEKNIYKNVLKYLGKVVGGESGSGMGSLNPSLFSKLILWYTDYLLYAGLCSYIDDDFFSRYINHHKLLVDEVKVLVDKVAPEYNYNNIVIRFYAVAAFYNFLLNRDDENLAKCIEYLDEKVSDDGVYGEYGEGFSYLNYVSEILLPVIYLGVQEEYLYGKNTGTKWIPDTSKIVDLYKKLGKHYLNSVSNWGELPAFDDGPINIPYLAPYSVITGKERYLQFSKDVARLCDNGMYDNLERAERVSIHGTAPWKIFLYPYKQSFSGSGNWKQPLDSVRHSGSIVQIPVGTESDNLNLTIIAEENPADGGTHDKIDHGAIQIARYVNNSSGVAPHVDHLIISPGYPGFDDNKRGQIEWYYCNQNVQMLWDSDIVISNSSGDAKPAKGADNEEFLAGKNHVNGNFIENQKFRYKENGGMTGYRYMTPWEMRQMVHKYVFNDKGLQDNEWKKADKMAFAMIKEKTLSHNGSGGKSTVLNRYKNGVEIKIEYKYPKNQNLYYFDETFYYNRSINYEESYYGIRGVYTLGNNYYVIDHLPQSSLPSTATLAASWNMPKNTTQRGTSGWKKFIFQGVTPSGEIPHTDPKEYYTPRSRIELAVAGANDVDTVKSLFQIKGNKDVDTIRTTHVTFENDLDDHPFLVTQIRTCDATNALVKIDKQTQNFETVTGGMVWTLEFRDGSKDMVVYNPENADQTVEGITSDAKVWLLHADNTGRWNTGRLFDATKSPTFNGFSSTPGVVNNRGQYDILF